MDKGKLIIVLNTLGLEQKSINLCLRTEELDSLDKFTMQYSDYNDLFEKNKQKIFQILISNMRFYGLRIKPIDIELNEQAKNAIYIEKDDKTLSPLFNKISIQGVYHDTEDIIKSYLNKNLEQLLYLDNINCKNNDYESLLEGLDNEILRNLEISILITFPLTIEPELLDSIYNHLKSKTRFYSIARFLLSGIWNVPLKEYNQRHIPNSAYYQKKAINTYRYPYKDD